MFQNVMLNNPNIASYCFDEESQEWCEVQLRVTQFFFSKLFCRQGTTAVGDPEFLINEPYLTSVVPLH
jgi:hypothetical protein